MIVWIILDCDWTLRRESAGCDEGHASGTDVRQRWSKALNEYSSPARLIYLLYNPRMHFIHHWFALHIECCQTSRCRVGCAVINLRNRGPFKRSAFNFSDTGPAVTWINTEYLSRKQNSFTSVMNSERRAPWITRVCVFGFCELRLSYSLRLSGTEKWDEWKYNYCLLLLCDCNFSSRRDSGLGSLLRPDVRSR